VSTSVLVAVIVGVVAYSIYCQVRGQVLLGTRMTLLPAGLIVLGLVDIAHMPAVGPADIACIAASAVVAAAIGLAQGARMRLAERNGVLWGQLPVKGLWLWAALIISRVVVMVAAHAVGAEAAASLDSIIFVLGLNRLAQTGAIAVRAAKAGLPIAA
jgi:hypothetical protein